MRGVRALATLLSLLVPAALPAAALAHATLLRSNPGAGTVVAHAPGRIVLHFDQPVQDAGTTVVAGSGASVLAGTPGSSTGTPGRSSCRCGAGSGTATT